MLDFDALLAQASLPEETVPICLDGRLVRRYEEVRDRIAARVQPAKPGDARLSGAPKDPEQADLDALVAQIQERTTVFTLRAMSRDKFVELVAEHPARRDPKTDVVEPRDRMLGVNTDTFIPAVVKASIVDPDVSVGDRWDKLVAVLTHRQLDDLGVMAWGLNREDREVPFSPSGSQSPLSSETGSGQPAPSE